MRTKKMLLKQNLHVSTSYSMFPSSIYEFDYELKNYKET